MVYERLIVFVVVVSCLVLPIHAWSFTAIPTGECGPMTVNWNGGTPPFKLGFHPVSAPAGVDNGEMTMTVDSSAFQNGQGSTSVTLPYAQGMKVIITMGDATGLLSGGASEIFTIGARPAGAASCTKAPGGNDFYFGNSGKTPKECESYAFTDISAAPGGGLKLPVTLLVIMPGGLGSYTTQLNSATSSPWTVNIAAGTTVLLGMIDGDGHNGGHDTLRTIAAGSTSCNPISLQAVPAVTLSATSTTASSTAGTPTTGTGSMTAGKGSASASAGFTTSAPSSISNAQSFSKGAIAGTVVGALVVLALLALLVFLLLRRRNRHDKDSNSSRDSENITFAHHVEPAGTMSYSDPSNARSSIPTTLPSSSSPPALSPAQSFTSASSPVRPTSPPISAYMHNTDISDVHPLDRPPLYSPVPVIAAAAGSPVGEMANSSSSGREQRGEHWTVDEKGMTGLSYRDPDSGSGPTVPKLANQEGWAVDEKGNTSLTYRPPGAGAPDPSASGAFRFS